MTKSVKQTEKEFLYYVKKMSNFKEAHGLMAWDLRTGAPKKGASQRAEVIGTLSAQVFQMSVSDEMASFIDILSGTDEIDEVTRDSVAECKKAYNKQKNIPEKEFQEYVVLTSNAESIWPEAKEKADFDTFRPYLEKIVEFNRSYVEWVGYEGNKYNALLDDYEPGLTVETLDRVFGDLRDQLVPLVKAVTESSYQPETDFLFKHFPADRQEAFSKIILEQMNYDFEAGRLDTTVHPFAIGLNPNDVRVTTKYDEDDFRTAVFGTIHEGGHALYEQNISEKYIGTPLCSGTSMGIHESQSLFWENFVGRNRAFWEKNYVLLKEQSSGQFDNVDLDTFYKGINVAGPSLIRIEADEMTYALHIIVRYELEKALINGDLEVKDLPKAWNDKMEEYLGVRPSHDGEGVLQDVHWSGGAFGYFPSYALGYVYAAQLMNVLRKDMNEGFESLLRNGDLGPVKEWMTRHVHQYGKSKLPLEILKETTGEEINAQYLIDYLKSKYSDVYKLNIQQAK
ncbi:carboxypeptidase M32 [Alteribacter keqinensis]|uniref:Metal-dependent carboxypeptidase n=1 Tax=Alteribacter keqinensis TaxID=2483800 RepID=A0A3M7TUR9_9BACI|nr:carboxypeptidase M32 [Alteribacter keqinensis]RNA69398.1 carboxypeptidase M32 [Alteribacter keqinensis]